MARKYEKGLKYFSHDTDLAWDEKIRKLTKRFGAQGYAVFLRLLECIFKDNYYIIFDTSLVFQILDSLNMNPDDEQLVVKVINEAVRIGLFEEKYFVEDKVITSHGIQVRYFDAKKSSLKRAAQNNGNLEHPYLLAENDNDAEAEITYTPAMRIETKLPPEEQAFADYMKEHYPYIAKMDKPLTLEEYHELCGKWGKKTVDSCIGNLNNYKNIKKYRCAKATLNNWCKNEQSRKPNNTTTLIGELRTINDAADNGDDLPE